LNVKFGRWKNFSPQAMDIALGYYGKTPAPVDPEVQEIAAGTANKEPITCRPADLIDPSMDKLREELNKQGLPHDDEHCVIWAMFPQELKKHYQNKSAEAAKPAPAQEVKAPPAPDPEPAQKAPAAPAAARPAGTREVHLSINGHDYTAIVEEVALSE
jgi:oxaloacetate decarboxylase alpha subunit/pyruvate carboxylase subunit B